MRARLIVLGALLLAPLPAAAQDKAAGAADAKQATAALAQKHFSDASGLYVSAFAKSKDPKYLLSAAGASQKGGDNAAAANLYARYLREAPDKAPARKAAQKELDGLSPKLAQLVIKADGARTVTLDGAALDLPLAPVVYASAAPHQIVATFDAGNGTAAVTPAAGTPANVTLTPPAPPPPPPPPVVAKSEPPPLPVKEEKHKPLPPAVVFVGAGLTVVAGALAIASAIDTNHQKSKFDAASTQENLDAGRDKEKRTNILLVATGGLAVLTGVTAILLVDWKGKPKNVTVGVGLGALSAAGTF